MEATSEDVDEVLGHSYRHEDEDEDEDGLGLEDRGRQFLLSPSFSEEMDLPEESDESSLSSGGAEEDESDEDESDDEDEEDSDDEESSEGESHEERSESETEQDRSQVLEHVGDGMRFSRFGRSRGEEFEENAILEEDFPLKSEENPVIVVIVPGSRFVKIGLVTEPFPRVLPCCKAGRMIRPQTSLSVNPAEQPQDMGMDVDSSRDQDGHDLFDPPTESFDDSSMSHFGRSSRRPQRSRRPSAAVLASMSGGSLSSIQKSPTSLDRSVPIRIDSKESISGTKVFTFEEPSPVDPEHVRRSEAVLAIRSEIRRLRVQLYNLGEDTFVKGRKKNSKKENEIVLFPPIRAERLLDSKQPSRSGSHDQDIHPSPLSSSNQTFQLGPAATALTISFSSLIRSASVLHEPNGEIKWSYFPTGSCHNRPELDSQGQELRDVYYANDALRTVPDRDAVIKFPMQCGHFAFRPGQFNPGTSLSELEDILRHLLRHELRLRENVIRISSAVVALPDVSDAEEVIEFVDLVLMRLRFGSCLVHPEVVFSCFGAGLSSACVVDIGESRIVVSFVEDGILDPDTMIILPYGMTDVHETFFWLLQNCGLSENICDIHSTVDESELRSVAEDLYCTLIEYEEPEIAFQFKRCRPNREMERYSIIVREEPLVACLSLFHPSVFSRSNIRSRRRELLPMSHALKRGTSSCIDTFDDMNGTDANIIRAPGKDFSLDNESFLVTEMAALDALPLIALDEAISRCLLSSSEYTKKGQVPAVLLTGGGGCIRGLPKTLETRLALFYGFTNGVNVIQYTRDSHPQHLSWIGASVLARLDSTREGWINRDEYETSGIDAVLDKAAFTWQNEMSS